MADEAAADDGDHGVIVRAVAGAAALRRDVGIESSVAIGASAAV